MTYSLIFERHSLLSWNSGSAASPDFVAAEELSGVRTAR